MTSSFSISPSRSMLHQPLSFPFARAVQDESELASSASFAIFNEADIASSVSKAKEDEHEQKEEFVVDSGPFSHCP